MNSLVLRLKDLGKTQQLSLKMLCLTLTICMVAVGTLSFAADSTTDNFIQVSKNADRSNSIALDGATVKGNVHIFVPSSGLLSASYFLDTNGNTDNSVMTSGKRSAPFDFAYTQSDGTAKAFDTTTLTEGKHTLIVSTRTGQNSYAKHTSEFIVDNVPDVVADPYIRVSKSADRSNAITLDQSIVSGNIYVHLNDSDVKTASYFLNTNGNYDNSAMTSGSRTLPFDFQYRERNGDAKPFDTKTLANGVHELAVTSQSKSTGTYDRHIVKFTVDNSSVTVVTQPPVTQPPVTQPPVTQPPVSFSPQFSGDVAPGNIRWGSAIGGNGDPVARHGAELGNRMGLRRTFWSMNKTSGLLSTAKADLAANRLPWVSVKLNGNWKQNGDGDYDASMIKLLTELSALNGPVWFTVHHEPEGGASSPGVDDPGGAPEWIRVQENTSKLLKQLRATGKGNNIGFSSVLMGWTWDSRSGRNPADWFKAGIWDFAGIDAYGDSESTAPMIETNGLSLARKFYGDRGLKVALGEWALRNQRHQETTAGEIPTLDEQRLAERKMQGFYDDILGSATDGQGAQIIGAAYFDSGLNSPNGSWELAYLQLPKFRQLISLNTSLQANRFK